MASNALKGSFIRHVGARSYAQAAPAVARKDAKLQHSVLPNKTFVAALDNGAPVTRVTVAFKAGSRYESPSDLGLAHVLRSAAGLTTTNASSFIIARKLAQAGASATKENLSPALECLNNLVSNQEFRPWELSDNVPRLKYDIAALGPQVRAVDLLHKAAFRRGLGNSLFISPKKIGKVSSESMQHFACSTLTPARCAVTVVGDAHDRAAMIAQALQLPSGESKGEPGKFFGALGNGPVTKWGADLSPLAKAIGNIGPFAAAGFNVSYSDNGLFGVVLSVPKDEANNAIKAVAKVLKSSSLSADAIKAGKSQLKVQLLSEADDGASLAESLAAQGLYTGSYQKQQQQQEIHYNMENTEEQSSTPRRKRRSRTKSKEGHVSDKKFGFYMHIKEVEAGLKNKTLVEGVLRINPKQFTHAYVSSSDRDEQDILIDGIKNRNRALEGDIVVVELVTECMNDDDDESENSKIDTSLDTINDGENAVSNSSNISNDPVHSRPDAKQKRGRVVYLKEKVHNRTCIGVLKLMADKNRQKALFVPRDHRIPRLNIPFTSWPDNFYQNSKSYENTLFLAKIIDWFDLRFATGKIIQSIGQSGDMITETKAILAQTDLDVTPFGREYRHLYPRLDYKIPEEEILLREDCRKLCIFSIDPSNCRDIDDAVSCRKLDNGNYEIGVHISDVSFFLTESTELDEKVAEKATTIYLVDKAYHMLPEELCMLCSLFPGVDKLAFSVFWEITENAEVLSHRFAKTVIHSCSQLAYEHAQAILEDREDAEISFPETYNGYQYKDIYETIKILGKIGAKFRQNRFENGALRIDQPKVAFHLNPFDGLPKSFWIYESKESHQLIEEFMLLANMTVAARIYKDHPNLAFLRCHPPPSGYMLKQLAKALKPMGIDLEISTAGDLQRSLLPYVAPDNVDKGRAMVLSMLCAKPMARAKLLAASLSCKGSPRWEVDKIRMIAAQCNKQKYNAKKAGELSTELYTLKYIEMHSPIVTDAVVVEVREKYIDDFPGDFKCVKNDAGAKLSRMEIDWKKKDVPDAPPVKQVIEVFSIVKIEMTKGNDLVKVETKLVTPDENVQN
ncbi:hypothetical protein MSG28_005223 [Choristoneura fumiferana]|uniref:Uncharacterized protein n=1 Tax=Choristoneura fumiferana TaxID=7141 RepID=A0ACC0JQL8_CHOFU|nr:hypothetical protein MSG28_005223 [Choristoneura fumiferana]